MIDQDRTRYYDRLAAGPDGIARGMTPRKYGALTRCSNATATRDVT